MLPPPHPHPKQVIKVAGVLACMWLKSAQHGLPNEMGDLTLGPGIHFQHCAAFKAVLARCRPEVAVSSCGKAVSAASV